MVKIALDPGHRRRWWLIDSTLQISNEFSGRPCSSGLIGNLNLDLKSPPKLSAVNGAGFSRCFNSRFEQLVIESRSRVRGGAPVTAAVAVSMGGGRREPLRRVAGGKAQGRARGRFRLTNNAFPTNQIALISQRPSVV